MSLSECFCRHLVGLPLLQTSLLWDEDGPGGSGQTTLSRGFGVCGRLQVRTPSLPCRSPCAPLRPSLRTPGTLARSRLLPPERPPDSPLACPASFSACFWPGLAPCCASISVPITITFAHDALRLRI